MALKAILIRKKIDNKKKELEGLRTKDAEFETRETEMEAAVNEADENITEEEQATLDEEIEEFSKEKKEHDQKKTDLEEEISKLEKELGELEKEQPKAEERKKGESEKMTNRTKFFNMTMQERDALFADEGVKSFIENVRTCIKDKRAISDTGLIIPQNFLPMIKEVVETQSKLLKYTNMSVLTGTSRTTIMGSIPEGVWTEQCGTLNELDLGFNDVEMDGFKVGGFFKVYNSILEDNDINLAAELISALGIAIAKAIDKAIPYGTGIKMPLGFVTRLAQETKPAGYSATERSWKDLNVTNIIKIADKKGIDLFKEIVRSLKLIYTDYASDNLVWIMNKRTHLDLIIEAMGTNMAAAIVSGMGSTMPIVGGTIEELEYMADGDIAFGYMSNYKIVQRKGMQIGQSEHVRFIQEQTVFKGTARYDGKPIIAESFALMNINGNEPAKKIRFAPDKANIEDVSLASLKIGTNGMFPAFKPEQTEYMVNTSNATSKVDAVPLNKSANILITVGDTTVNNGESATWKEGENLLTVKVTYQDVERVYSVTVIKTGA